MKIDVLSDLTEAHRRTLMYHGTSSKFLRPIMVSGVVPNPPQKFWDKDTDASQSMGSRASLEGSYWTTNLLTATSAAWNAQKKFGGNQLLVMAEIVQQAAYADEDSVKYTVDGAWGQMAKQLFGVVPDAISHLAWSWFGTHQGQNYREKMIETFSTDLHGLLRLSDAHPLNYNMIADLMYAYLMRRLAYVWKSHTDSKGVNTNPFYGWPEKTVAEVTPQIPTPNDAESNYLHMLDRLSRAYRKSAQTKHDPDAFNLTARVPQVVGFSGAHRIVCIVELIQKEDRSQLIVVRYGKIPDQLLTDWRSRKGEPKIGSA